MSKNLGSSRVAPVWHIDANARAPEALMVEMPVTGCYLLPDDPSSPAGAGHQQPRAPGFTPAEPPAAAPPKASAIMRAIVALSRVGDASQRTRLASEIEAALTAGKPIERMLERLEAEGGDPKKCRRYFAGFDGSREPKLRTKREFDIPSSVSAGRSA